MIFQWFDANEAEKIAGELADQFAPRSAGTSDAATAHDGDAALRDLIRLVQTDARLSSLNFYKKAKFANSFKWRLLEKGVEPNTANHVTTSLVVNLTRGPQTAEPSAVAAEGGAAKKPGNIPDLLRNGNKAFTSGEYQEAVRILESAVDRSRPHPVVLNSLGASLFKLGRYSEAEVRFRQSVTVAPDYPEPNCNLGNLLRWMGGLEESEYFLRRALKWKPTYVDARVGLGLTLTLLGRPRDARARFQKVLRSNPRHPDALFGMAQVAKVEGRFSEAETLIGKVLEINPKMVGAWSLLANLRKMTPADRDWLRTATELAAGDVRPIEEADLRFSIGKYYDDVGEFDKAFRSFEAANTLVKSFATKYDRRGRDEFIDEVLGASSKELVAAIGAGASPSVKPVFVIGMPRSGTSLTEQILASHPAIKGAGEVDFWNRVLRKRLDEVTAGLLDLSTRKQLADEYLQLLEQRTGDAPHIVDKTTANLDSVGLIYSVFANARFIYMERDPIDTCLSCYFQQFAASVSFSMDLADLAHYYKGYRRLVHHWQSVLPPGRILTVSYEELVRDLESTTRRMLDFLGLEWDAQCLSFYENERPVATASTWQVRQKIYTNAIGRSQAYKKYTGPLKTLKA